jgi:hypothetical protein
VGRRFGPSIALDGDQFLVQQWWQQWWLEPRPVARVILEQSEGTRRPHFDPPRLLQALGRVVPEFAHLVADSQQLS